MNNSFQLEEKEQCLMSMTNLNDPYQMEWVKENRQWGKVVINNKRQLSSEVKREKKGEKLEEKFIFTNNTSEPIFTFIEDIAIEIPFPDEYVTALISETKRCHIHIWCGDSSSYVAGIRMNGEGPHLGLILKEGSLVKYSVERNVQFSSNDRGIFFLHPEPICLMPGKSYTISWDLVWFNKQEEFDNLRLTYPNQVAVNLKHFVSQENEENVGVIQFHPQLNLETVSLSIKNQPIDYKVENNQIKFNLSNFPQGEHQGLITYNGYKSHFSFLVYPAFQELLTKRMDFLLENQQVLKDEFLGLKGSFLSYDNEEKHLFYSVKNDYNAARERVCMGLCLIKYAEKMKDPKIDERLDLWIEFLLRELIDQNTGEVFDDYQQSYFFRLYNYPWMMIICHELYMYKKDIFYLELLVKIIFKYYELGGAEHYPIGLWFSEWLPEINHHFDQTVTAKVKALFKKHAENIIENGTNYPPFEVKYEQSILAPAVAILLDAYQVFEEERYLVEAKKHLELLTLFEGNQPDFHLNHVAIRHWDGYWFGKRKVYGDTFPHYWSGLNGMIYLKLYEILGDEKYLTLANRSIRGILSLITPDGQGSCAYIYPFMVNGVKGEFLDPLANDQDWSVYFAQRLIEVNKNS